MGFLKMVILPRGVVATTFESDKMVFLGFFWKNLHYSGQIENAKNGFFGFLVFFCHFLVWVLMVEICTFGPPLFTHRS